MNRADPDKSFLGMGWAFPVCARAGAIEAAALEEDIRQAILIILGTNPGERVMRPDFGAGLNAFIFEPVNETTRQLIRTRVTEALIDWEPRIDVEEVRVTPGGVGRQGRLATAEAQFASMQNALLINIDYRVRATNTLSNLVYPFYLEEGAQQ